MDKDDSLLDEWRALRDEIMECHKSNERYIPVIVFVAGAGLAFALQSKMFVSSMIAIVVANAAAFLGGDMLEAKRRQIWRAATYNRIFIEPKIEGINWETRINKLYVMGKEKAKDAAFGVLSRRVEEVLELDIVATLHIGCCIVALWKLIEIAEDDWAILTGVAVVVISVVLAVYRKARAARFRRGGLVEKEFAERWNTVLSEEAALASAPKGGCEPR